MLVGIGRFPSRFTNYYLLSIHVQKVQGTAHDPTLKITYKTFDYYLCLKYLCRYRNK